MEMDNYRIVDIDPMVGEPTADAVEIPANTQITLTRNQSNLIFHTPNSRERVDQANNLNNVDHGMYQLSDTAE